jgi:hypothetical protein
VTVEDFNIPLCSCPCPALAIYFGSLRQSLLQEKARLQGNAHAPAATAEQSTSEEVRLAALQALCQVLFDSNPQHSLEQRLQRKQAAILAEERCCKEAALKQEFEKQQAAFERKRAENVEAAYKAVLAETNKHIARRYCSITQQISYVAPTKELGLIVLQRHVLLADRSSGCMFHIAHCVYREQETRELLARRQLKLRCDELREEVALQHRCTHFHKLVNISCGSMYGSASPQSCVDTILHHCSHTWTIH